MTDQPAVPETWVEAIFTRLSAQLGSKVADLYGAVPAETVKTEWAEALTGFDPSEITRGLKACQTRAFAPTLGEFLRLCRPALDPEVAWIEAGYGMRARESGDTGEWSHPAVYRAARDMQHELRTGSFREHRKRWEWLLNREFQRGWGVMGVPVPARRIGNESTPRPPTAEERQHLADLRNVCRPAPPKPEAA